MAIECVAWREKTTEKKIVMRRDLCNFILVKQKLNVQIWQFIGVGELIAMRFVLQLN